MMAVFDMRELDIMQSYAGDEARTAVAYNTHQVASASFIVDGGSNYPRAKRNGVRGTNEDDVAAAAAAAPRSRQPNKSPFLYLF